MVVNRVAIHALRGSATSVGMGKRMAFVASVATTRMPVVTNTGFSSSDGVFLLAANVSYRIESRQSACCEIGTNRHSSTQIGESELRDRLTSGIEGQSD